MLYDLETFREKVWTDFKAHQSDIEPLYATMRDAWLQMDENAVMAMPKEVVTLILMSLATSLGEMQYQDNIELARVRNSN